jgi:integrase
MISAAEQRDSSTSRAIDRLNGDGDFTGGGISRDLIRLHIASVIGDLKLAKLTAADLQALYANRLATPARRRRRGEPQDAPARPLSATTVRYIHAVVHHALEDAVRWGLLVRNVADAVEPPRRGRGELVVWTAEEVRRVLRAAEGDDLEALWRLALTTGMRRGEVLGVKWSDLDWEAGALAVQRRLGRGETARLTEDEPKTPTSRRRIALDAATLAALKRHRARQAEHRLKLGEAYTDRGYVFTGTFGAPLHPNVLYRRFAALIARAGVRPVRFHDLRHTSATLALALGVHPKIVAEPLGHSSIGMTLDLYSHVSADMQRQAAEAIAGALAAAERLA